MRQISLIRSSTTLKLALWAGLAASLLCGCEKVSQTQKDVEQVAAKGQSTLDDAQKKIKDTQEAIDNAKKAVDDTKKTVDNARKSISDFTDRFRSDWDKLNRQLDGLTQLSTKPEIQSGLSAINKMITSLKAEAATEENKNRIAQMKAQTDRLVSAMKLGDLEQRWNKMVNDLNIDINKLSEARLKNKDFRKLDDEYRMVQKSYEKAYDRVSDLQTEKK